MELHDETVVEAHARHLGQNLCPEQLRVPSTDLRPQDPTEQLLGGGFVEIGCPGSGVTMIARGCAPRLEVLAAGPVGLEVTGPGHRRAGHRNECLQVRSEVLAAGVDHGVGAVGRYHAAAPARVPYGIVMPESSRAASVVAMTSIRKRSNSARGLKFRAGKQVIDLVINAVRAFAPEPLANAERVVQRLLEPQAGGGSPEQMKVLGKEPPDLARISFHRLAVPAPDAQPLQRNTLRVEHPKHVVIGCDEQCRRITEVPVGSEPFRIGVAMRRYDRQVRSRRRKAFARLRERPGPAGTTDLHASQVFPCPQSLRVAGLNAL